MKKLIVMLGAVLALSLLLVGAWEVYSVLADRGASLTGADDGALNQVLQAGGFSAWEEQSLRFSPRVDPDSNFWRPQLALRLGDRLGAMDDGERQRLDDAMRQAYEDLRDGDRAQLQVHARIGIGTA